MDYKSSTILTKVISRDLINNLNFFKAITKAKDIQSNDTERIAQDGAIIKGEFIFSISTTNIYNRFKRKFVNKLKWFSFTPRDVIDLSKYITASEKKEIIYK